MLSRGENLAHRLIEGVRLPLRVERLKLVVESRETNDIQRGPTQPAKNVNIRGFAVSRNHGVPGVTELDGAVSSMTEQNQGNETCLD